MKAIISAICMASCAGMTYCFWQLSIDRPELSLFRTAGNMTGIGTAVFFMLTLGFWAFGGKK